MIKNRTAILAVSCLLTGSLIAGSMRSSVQAATRLYGVQQLVEELSSGTAGFDILEIVPDYAAASMAFYGDGSDVIIDSRYLAGAEDAAAREAAVETLLEGIRKDALDVRLTEYHEQLYASSDVHTFRVLDRSGQPETRTGQFRRADEVRGAMGNYSMTPKMTLRLDLYDEDGRLLRPSDETVEIGDTVTVKLQVTSGRRSEEEGAALPAQITIRTDGTGSLTGPDAPGEDSSMTWSIADLYAMASDVYEFTYQVTDEDKQRDAGVSFLAEGICGGDTYAADSRQLTYPDYNRETARKTTEIAVEQILTETGDGAVVTVTLTADRRPEQDITLQIPAAGTTVTMDLTPDLFRQEDGRYVWETSYDAEGTTHTEIIAEETEEELEAEETEAADTETPEEETYTYVTYEVSTILVNGQEIDDTHGTVEVSYTDVAVEAGAALITEVPVEHPASIDDFWYNESDGEYVWMDGTDEAGGDVTAEIPVGKVYYKVQVQANSLFASKILELTEASEQKLYEKVKVHTYTPADLEEALRNNELAMGSIDLVYVSNSSILPVSGLADPAAYDDRETGEDAEYYANDFSLDTAFNIYQYAMNANLPVIVDRSVMDDPALDAVKLRTANGITSVGSNLLRLVYLLRHTMVTGMPVTGETAEADWTEEYVQALLSAEPSYGTFGCISSNIFFHSDAQAGSVVTADPGDVIFTYESRENSFGEDVLVGMTNLVHEISNDNFYNKNNADEYTTGYTMDESGFETIAVSRADLLRYILNYDRRRVTLYKDTIKVLDIEPTKYSTLSREDIEGWLGMRGTYQVAVNNGSQMSYDASAKKIEGHSGNYSETYIHNWTSSNENVAAVDGSGRDASLRVVGPGSVTISHSYYYQKWHDGTWTWSGRTEGYYSNEDMHTETITLTVSEDASGESGIKELSITQLSTSEFIGRLEDLIENYDMVYIGACIGPYNADGSMNQDSSGRTRYNDSSLDGKIYLHVGDEVYSTHSELRGLMNDERTSGVSSVTTRYSGNDLTEDKYNELLEYAAAGYPIVFDPKLYDGENVNTGYLDNSSYMYKLICSVAQGYTSTRVITNEEYENLDAADRTGFVRGEDASYTHTYTKIHTSYRLTRITEYHDLREAGAKYVITNANNNKYWMIDGSDRTLNSGIAADLESSPASVMVPESAIDDKYLWSVSEYDDRTKHMVTVTASDGRKLYCTTNRDSSDGSALAANGSAMVIEKRSVNGQFTNAFFLYNEYGSGNSYLNARGGKAGTYHTADAGSSWFIYKAEPVSGESTPVTEKITAEEYAAHEGEAGYEKNVTFYWTRSESQDGVANVMAANTGRSVLNKLVKYINMPRLNMVLTSAPTEYSSTTNTDGTLSQVGWMDSVGGRYYLDYEFEFSNTAESAAGSSDYTVSLYVDVNADGRYVPSEKLDGLSVTDLQTRRSAAYDALKTGVRYRVRRELPQDYVGLLPWKLVIRMNTAVGGSDVRASKIGYTAVANQTTTPTTIKVLQIMPEDNRVNLNTYGYFPKLIESVEKQMNYDLQITAISVANIKKAYTDGRYTGPEDFYERYLKSYDMLIWGYWDMYGSKDFDENLIRAFGMFIDSGKSTLFSHDLTSFNNGYYGNGVGDWGYYMNQYLRSAAGMDRYGITEDALHFLKGKNSKTTYTLGDDNWKSILANNKDVASAPAAGSEKTTYGGVHGYTNNLMNYYHNDTYKDLKRSSNETRVTKISQTNEGQITKYPFNVDITQMDPETGEERAQWRSEYDSEYFVENTAMAGVATTHYQYYQLDYNYDTDGDGTNNLVVWYVLNGGTYASQPNDVRNNYYIYSVGNITYTGMGHTESNQNPGITLAEAQLFVNTIVAAYNAGTKNPSVNIVENVNDKNASVDYIYRTFDEDAPADNRNNETFAFYVNDTNVIQGRKQIDVWYYREIGRSTYDEAVAAAGSEDLAEETGFFRTALADGTVVYLQAYDREAGGSNYIGDVLAEYSTAVDNYITYEVEVKGSWINDRLENSSQGNAAIWVGARTTLDFAAANRRDEVTDRVFDCVTFKKRNLIPLD